MRFPIPIVNIIFSTLLLMITTRQVFGQAKSDTIKVLIVDGFSNHDWKQTSHLVKSILEDSGLFKVHISTVPTEVNPDALMNWNPRFDAFQVVIQNTNNIHNTALRWPKSIEQKLEEYVASGGGLYILHSANNAFPHWEAYNIMIGLGWRSPAEGIAIQVKESGELHTIPLGEGKETYHGPRNDEIIHILNDHPINMGFPKKWKTPDMELYKFARGPAQKLTVLSYAKETETGINWPVEWTVDYGKGRVYNSSMGHLWTGETYPISYQCVGFQTTLIRATEWLATGKTTYPIPKDFPTEQDLKLVVIDK